MLYLSLALRRATPAAGAARHRLIALAHHRIAAHGAMAGQQHQLRAGHTALRQHSSHLGDNIAGAADDDGIAHPHVLARQFIHVVQRRVAHRDAADEGRLQTRHGRERTGAAHLKFNAADNAERLFGREFMRDGPTRRPGNESQLALQIHIIHFVNHAVDLVGQRRARRAHVAIVRKASLDRLDHGRLGTDLETQRAQLPQGFAVKLGQFAALDHSDAIDEQVERTRRRHARVELAQAAGGGVAWIDEGLLAAGCRLLVEPPKSRQRHENFAAHLEHFRKFRAAQPERQRLDGSQVLRNIFAGFAVAAGRALHETAVFVARADRQTIQFRLGRISNGSARRQPLLNSAIEITHLVVAERIIQGQHGHPVLHRAEGGEGRGAHALGR